MPIWHEGRWIPGNPTPMRIFVYGTLKRGLSNHGWMAGQTFVSETRTAPHYRLADCGGYPGLYPVDQDGLSIRGEVWEVDEAGRENLDILEDVDAGLYALETVSLEPVSKVPVLTYVYKRPVNGFPDVGDSWTE